MAATISLTSVKVRIFLSLCSLLTLMLKKLWVLLVGMSFFCNDREHWIFIVQVYIDLSKNCSIIHVFDKKTIFCLSLNFLNIMLKSRLRFS